MHIQDCNTAINNIHAVKCQNVCNRSSTAYIDTTSVSILSALEVVVGSIVGFLVFHESMRLSQVIGALTIMVGALLPNVREKLRSRKAA